MENKINIAELLKDCPKGMELDCASYNNVSFDKISDNEKSIYPIFCYITDKEGNRSYISFTENGCESKRYGAKCVIFPKGKTTWEGFQRPFKDGDIVVGKNNACSYITIFREFIDDISFSHHACLTSFGKFKVNDVSDNANLRFATEEEKQTLFDAIKANGYKWNAETKSLEKLSRFKTGNRIKRKGVADIYAIEIANAGQLIYTFKGGNCQSVEFVDREYELVSDKFDITTLVPFESRVLVRSSMDGLWKPAVFGFRNGYNDNAFYIVGGSCWKQCIPYLNNEHLCGTTNDCDEYYKTWK